MAATIVQRSDSAFPVQIEVPYKASMPEAEEAILQALNQAGVAATEEVLGRFDTDGSPLRIGPTEMTPMGRVPEQYQTPSGVATVARHIYQGPQGGKTYCPPDQNARIVISSTPKFARMIAFKYAEFGAGRVTEDLHEDHGRRVVRSFVPGVAGAVAAVALATGETWECALPALGEPVATITSGWMGPVC